MGVVGNVYTGSECLRKGSKALWGKLKIQLLLLLISSKNHSTSQGKTNASKMGITEAKQRCIFSNIA